MKSKILYPGRAVIVVGQTGAGKTTQTKKLIEGVKPDRLFIYDVNNEYKNHYLEDKPLLDFEDFLNIGEKLGNTVLVFEEATIFFNNRGSQKQMINILVRKRHTQNAIILVFHSLRSIPIYIMDLCTDILILKTKDNRKLIEDKFKGMDNILNGFNEVKKSKSNYPVYYSEL